MYMWELSDWIRGKIGNLSWNIRAWWYNRVVLWWKYERTGNPRPVMPKIGMKDIVYAQLHNESDGSCSPTYGNVKDVDWVEEK